MRVRISASKLPISPSPPPPFVKPGSTWEYKGDLLRRPGCGIRGWASGFWGSLCAAPLLTGQTPENERIIVRFVNQTLSRPAGNWERSEKIIHRDATPRRRWRSLSDNRAFLVSQIWDSYKYSAERVPLRSENPPAAPTKPQIKVC